MEVVSSLLTRLSFEEGSEVECGVPRPGGKKYIWLEDSRGGKVEVPFEGRST